MTKEEEVMGFLGDRVFDPILDSPQASKGLKSGVRMTRTRMQKRDAAGMVAYYWSAIIGTDRSTKFARQMRAEGSRASKRCSMNSGIASTVVGCDRDLHRGLGLALSPAGRFRRLRRRPSTV